MNALLQSAKDFARGIAKRFYWWLFAFLLNPWDIYEKFIRDSLPPQLHFDWPFGGTTFAYVLVAGLLVSSLLTYHELRIAYAELEERARRNDVARNAHQRLSHLRSIAVDHLWANHVSIEEFENSWLPRHQRWEDTVERHLRKHFGSTIADRFRDLGQLPGKKFVPNRRYNQRMNMLDKELEIIDEALRIPSESKS